jgi:AhpD family alkylhydroperoxidase
MPYIPLEDHLPGITGLLEYRKDSAAPIRELTQTLLRGPSTLTEGERELIATVVSHRNQCTFCTTAHTAAANILLGEEETAASVKKDIGTAPVSDKIVQKAKDAGATDLEIHDTVLIAALFCLYNRYVDGLSTVTPTDPAFYKGLGERLKNNGYNRLQQGYDHLKN